MTDTSRSDSGASQEPLDFPVGADRPPTDDEARAADEAAADVDPSVGEHYKEMIERGANVKGEGEIEPS